MTQKELREIVLALSGEQMSESTVHRWVAGSRKPPQIACAFVELVSRLTPRELEEKMRQVGE